MSTTKIWAHRGASAYAPENTLAAFALAAEMEADGIELDVHLTADDQLVVAHDEQVDRVSNGQGYIRRMTLEELRTLDFGAHHPRYRGEKIPTLAEVYDLIRPTKMTINVEIKSGIVLYPGIEEKLVTLTREAGMTGRVIYSSFNHYSLMALRQLEPEAPIGLLYSCALVDPWLYAQHLKANALHPLYLTLQAPGLVEGCRATGIKLHPWTVDDPTAMGRLMAMNIDAVITNKPDVARAVREQS